MARDTNMQKLNPVDFTVFDTASQPERIFTGVGKQTVPFRYGDFCGDPKNYQFKSAVMRKYYALVVDFCKRNNLTNIRIGVEGVIPENAEWVPDASNPPGDKFNRSKGRLFDRRDGTPVNSKESFVLVAGDELSGVRVPYSPPSITWFATMKKRLPRFLCWGKNEGSQYGITPTSSQFKK